MCWLFARVFTLSAVASTIVVVERAAAQAPPAIERFTVWRAGVDGYHTYRIPALLVTARGTLLAFCEGRKTSSADHGDVDLLVKRSADGGRTWSAQQVVYEEGGDARITIGNPCPVVDRADGTIWLLFTRDNDTVHVTNSRDDGLTWADPVEITASVKAAGWTWYATGPGVGIQLRHGPDAGRLVVPCDHRDRHGAGTAKFSHVFYSDDHGATWQLGGTVSPHTDECQVVELGDGDLLINMRNYWERDGKDASKGRRRAVARSTDGGRSWGPLEFDATLIEPVCQASLIGWASGSTEPADLLLFSNPASRTRRENLTVRLSRDSGRTWPQQVVVQSGPAAYSCLAQLPDGALGCLFETGEAGTYERLELARFTWDALAPAGRSAGER